MCAPLCQRGPPAGASLCVLGMDLVPTATSGTRLPAGAPVATLHVLFSHRTHLRHLSSTLATQKPLILQTVALCEPIGFGNIYSLYTVLCSVGWHPAPTPARMCG